MNRTIVGRMVLGVLLVLAATAAIASVLVWRRDQPLGAQSSEKARASAIALVHQQRWRDALPLLEQSLETNPDDPFLLRSATTCRFQLGRTDAALESAARLAELNGHEHEGLFLAGVIHRAQGDTHLAIDAWSAIELRRPDAQGLPIEPAEFFLIFGEDLLLQALPQTALAKLRKSRELDESLPVMLRLGEAWAMAGDDAQAAAAWKRALDFDAENADARNGLAELALSRADADGALRWLAPIASKPDVSSTTAYLMERAHTLLGNDEELEHWQRQGAELRRSEKLRAALQRKFRRGS